MNTQTPAHPSPPRVSGVVMVVLAVVVTVAVILLVLVGRAVLRGHYEKSKSYPDAFSIPPHNGVFVLPDWAPRDATDIKIQVQTQGKGRSLRFKTETSDVPAGCVATSRPDKNPVPDLDLGRTTDATQGYRCGEWFIVRHDKTVLAWTAYRGA